MTCKECYHYDVCGGYLPTDCDTNEVLEMCAKGKSDEIPDIEDRCSEFKDKSLIVELPCKVGDTVYDIGEFFECNYHPEMYELGTDYITLSKDKETGELLFGIDGIDFKCEDFGKTVFLTRKAAEQALTRKEGE